MLNIRKLMNAQIQEFVFFSSLAMAFTVLFSGILFISFDIGNLAINALFSLMGYTYFYFSVVFLHMGYVTNFHVFNLRDFKRQAPILVSALFAHFVIVFLFSNLLTVIQISMGFSAGEMLVRGAGGWFGLLLSKALYLQLGAFGSLIALSALMIVTALLGGFFDIPEVVSVVNDTPSNPQKKTSLTKSQTSSFIAGLQLLTRSEENTVTNQGSMARTWMAGPINKAHHFVADQFPVSKKNETAVKKNEKVVGSVQLKTSKKESVKLPAKKSSVSHFMRRKISSESLSRAQTLLDSFLKKNQAKSKSTIKNKINKKKTVIKKTKKK